MKTSKKKKATEAIQVLSADIFYAKVRGEPKGIENTTHENPKGIENTTHENPKGIENATHENPKGIENATHKKSDYCIMALRSLKMHNKGLTALGMLFLLKSFLSDEGGRIKIDKIVEMTGMAKSNVLVQLEALEVAGIIHTAARDKLGRLIRFESVVGNA